MTLDVLFLHPLAIYDFRKLPLFYGPIAQTVPPSTPMFIAPPIGIVSIAEFLERNGISTRIVNLGDWMVYEENFNPELYIKKIDARIYAIDLHWAIHSQGAIEIAQLCKKYHPNSSVILGGLTATYFHTELMKKFPFIDAIIRGESEHSMLQLVNTDTSVKKLRTIPNLTFRDKKSGKIINSPLAKPVDTLDLFDFSRIDLIEPKFTFSMTRWWNIPVCRGCTYNCIFCGGSAYSYAKYFHRDKPAFRSPEKILADLAFLKEQGIQSIFLFQDIRMGGKKYVRNFISNFQKEKLDFELLSLELFSPADNDFIQKIKRIGGNE